MPRKIKGYKFMERHRDAWEELKAIRIYRVLYGKKNVKVLFLVNQYGQPYTDIYVKKGAKKRKIKR